MILAKLGYGWGNEDTERYHRFQNLGYKIYRTSGPLYHLSHPRDLNGKFHSELQYHKTLYAKNNQKVIKKITFCFTTSSNLLTSVILPTKSFGNPRPFKYMTSILSITRGCT
jgi:hypothetical protein